MKTKEFKMKKYIPKYTYAILIPASFFLLDEEKENLER